jgi:hypothetical protein
MPGGSGTRLQVSLASRASYSACIVARQLGSDSASRTERGRGDLGTAWRLRRSTGCAMPALPRVRIGDRRDGDRSSVSYMAGAAGNNLGASTRGSRTDSTRGHYGDGAAGSGLCGVHKGSSASRRGWRREGGAMGSGARPRGPWSCAGTGRHRGGLGHGVCHRRICGTCMHKTSSRN